MLTSVAFLTARRWPDLSPPDRLAAAALRRFGVRVEPVIWDENVTWSNYDALVIRSTWDYPEKVGKFLAWLNHIESLPVPLVNPPSTVRWNLDKRYLDALQQRGVPVVPTHFGEPGDRLASILDARQWPQAVVKPRISADGYKTFRTDASRAQDDDAGFAELLHSPNGVMVQAFLPQLQESGEYSFVFFDGQFSHAVLKRPAPGDYRVQERFGGTLHAFEPDFELVRQVESFLEAVPVPWAYARVDVCPIADRLLVMEVELIEPSLLFDHASASAADHFAEAVLIAAVR